MGTAACPMISSTMSSSCFMLFLYFFSFFTMFHPCVTFRNSVWNVDLPIRSEISGPTNGWVPTSRKGLNVQRAKWQCVTSPMQPPCAMRRTLRPQAPIFSVVCWWICFHPKTACIWIYHLVIEHSHGKSPFLIGKPSINGPFSMANYVK